LGKSGKSSAVDLSCHLYFYSAPFEFCGNNVSYGGRVSFETIFDWKQPKLEPKLVSALSETKRLFRLFRFYTETESFDVSIEPKQTEDQPKQFDREHILLFFTENLGFSVFFVYFFLQFFRFVSKQFVSAVSLQYQNREFRCFN
jgi:hypothetical protein